MTFRELWDGPLQFRADGVWVAKTAARLFAARRDHEFHMQRFHCHRAPLNSKENGGFPRADLTIYHLRMMHAADRHARRERYQTLDPTRQYQAVGYEYPHRGRGAPAETGTPGGSTALAPGRPRPRHRHIMTVGARPANDEARRRRKVPLTPRSRLDRSGVAEGLGLQVLVFALVDDALVEQLLGLAI